ncbi:MAG: V-type ATP synthase subunit D [Synergistaceae bacterium]|nr:V-type ATP synthase subunit D [Synergistaceae bacterium]
MAKRLSVNPNRMELSRLKKRIVVAKRGHKLLKDKQDALIKAFLERAKNVKVLREDLEAELAECYQSFLLARAQTLPVMLEQALMISSMRCHIKASERNVMSVIIPEYEVKQEGEGLSYGLANTSASLDLSLERFSALLPKLIHLAAEEKGLKLMAKEIEKTRRRVNALEHVLIPSFQETARYITMKLDEQERAGLSRLMRIKEIVRSH